MAWPRGAHNSDFNGYHWEFSKVAGPGYAPASSWSFYVPASCPHCDNVKLLHVCWSDGRKRTFNFNRASSWLLVRLSIFLCIYWRVIFRLLWLLPSPFFTFSHWFFKKFLLQSPGHQSFASSLCLFWSASIKSCVLCQSSVGPDRLTYTNLALEAQ